MADFLRLHEHGVYTTAAAVQGGLLCWTLHRQRLADAFALYTAAVCGRAGCLSAGFLDRAGAAVRQGCAACDPLASLRVVVVLHSTCQPLRCCCSVPRLRLLLLACRAHAQLPRPQARRGRLGRLGAGQPSRVAVGLCHALRGCADHRPASLVARGQALQMGARQAGAAALPVSWSHACPSFPSSEALPVQAAS